VVASFAVWRDHPYQLAGRADFGFRGVAVGEIDRPVELSPGLLHRGGDESVYFKIRPNRGGRRGEIFMANTATGYLAIQFPEPNPLASEEITRAILESSLFNYEACEISEDDSGLSGVFFPRWDADSCWEWINHELGAKASELTPESKSALIASEISGYSYEWGCQYRDRVEKIEGETRLTEYQLSFLDLPEALKFLKAFELRVGGSLSEGNGVQIKLLKRGETEKKGVEQFEFAVSGDQGCTVKINFRTRTRKILDTVFVDEIDESAMNELLDDLLCERDDLYKKVRGPKRKPVKKNANTGKSRKKSAGKKTSKKKSKAKSSAKKKSTKKKATRKKATRKKARRKKS